MSYCLNPACQKPQNPPGGKFCQNCGSKLVLRERYRALQKIGQGGFGRTFLAIDEDKPSKPSCVIKQFFPQDQGTNNAEKAAELFRQEAVRLDDLGKHPQIPELLAHFEQDNRQYLVQEFIDGRNLAEELAEEGAFNENQIRSLLFDLLPVLQFIHERQVIHRDIKPENIIRPGDSQLVLVDFGAAKFVTGKITGTVIGSAGYVAPEQSIGKAVFASDIYSLGITCIHLLTGVEPFDLYSFSEGAWVWRDFLTSPVSDNLGQILDKMLANALNQRYQSVAELLRDLQPQPTQLSAEEYYKQGMTKAQRGNYREAINDFNLAVSIDSNFAEAYKFCGLAYSRISEKQVAIEKFQKAAELYLKQGKVSNYQDVLNRIQKLQTPSPSPQRQSNWATKSSKIVAIDLGTTKSVVAIFEGEKPKVIPNAEGFSTTPSVIAFTSNGNCLVGYAAKRQAVTNPLNTFSLFMRFLGCEYDEIAQEAQQVSYIVLRDNQGKIKFDCPVLNREFTPEEILAQLLCKLADDASLYIGEEVTQAVIAVPSHFNYIQRQAVREAGRIAGLEVLRLINQPTAAALMYSLNKKSIETIMIFNLGGGNCDVSILEIGNGVFEVLATCGDPKLGTDDFAQKIIDWLVKEFQKIEGINPHHYYQARQRLIEAADKAKIELSNATETEIDLPFLVESKHLKMTLTRAKFENLSADLITRCGVLVERAIKDSRINKNDINQVILIGGGTRIPIIRESVQRILSKKPIQGLNPDEAVALGLAVQAGILSGDANTKDILLLDVTSLSLGVETLGGFMTKIITRNTSIPTKKSDVFSTSIDGQDHVEIHILEGEEELAKDNKSLAMFRLEGIPPAPKGVPQIEVIFDIDDNSILNVSAKDKVTGKRKSVQISGYVNSVLNAKVDREYLPTIHEESKD